MILLKDLEMVSVLKKYSSVIIVPEMSTVEMNLSCTPTWLRYNYSAIERNHLIYSATWVALKIIMPTEKKKSLKKNHNV